MLRETALVPVVVSFFATLFLSRVSKLECAGGIALAIAFFAGWASQEWTTLKPTRYLDWLPYSALLLAVAAIIALKLPARFRWLFSGVAIVLVTWLMVPSFDRLQPARPVAIALVAGVSWGLAIVSVELTSRLPQRMLIAALMAMGATGSLVVVQSFGMKVAQITGMLAAASTGALIFRGDRLVAGVSSVFLPLLCNILFMGFATSTSEVPWFSFALVPLAVLPLRIYPSDPQPHEFRRRIIAWTLFVLVLLAALVPALLVNPPWEEDLAQAFAQMAAQCG